LSAHRAVLRISQLYKASEQDKASVRRIIGTKNADIDLRPFSALTLASAPLFWLRVSLFDLDINLDLRETTATLASQRLEIWMAIKLRFDAQQFDCGVDLRPNVRGYFPVIPAVDAAAAIDRGIIASKGDHDHKIVIRGVDFLLQKCVN